MHLSRLSFVRALAALGAAAALAITTVSAVAAHESRTVAGYDTEVGLINEPVYVGDKSGLEFSVQKDGQPVEGLEKTLTATVTYGSQSRDLELSARDDAPGWYESAFIPTAAGPYTFGIKGTIEGAAIDETFTSSPSGFNEVQEQASGQFPNQLPTVTDLQAKASRGASAADQVPIALALGGAGLVAGLIALGVALASRRRSG